MSIKERFKKLPSELRYGFYVMFHPADGFWCISREKKASVFSANIMLLLLVIVEILRYVFTNFQFLDINMEYFNAFGTALNMIIPIVLWTVANWAFTTLLDGKGRFADIYVATVYSFFPLLIVNAVLIPISQILTYQEGTIYFIPSTIAWIWVVLLLLVAMMQIHDYTLLKAVGCAILTVGGIAVIIFLFMIFFSLVSDAVYYFVSLVREIIFRLY